LSVEQFCICGNYVNCPALAQLSDDPFAAFSEWASEADEKAYGRL
jgi:hypothetical protein